jgi:hypothetical protein
MPEHLSDTTNQPSEFADPEASGRETKTLTSFGTDFRDDAYSTGAMRRLPFGVDFGTGFRDAEDLDFRASRVCPKTYPFPDAGGKSS